MIGPDGPDAHPLSLDELLNLDAADPKALHEKAADLTRRRILLAAMECFAEKGFQKASIREIAANAGVTMGAVYHHFSGKKELLMRLNRSRQLKSNELLAKALGEGRNVFEALRGALEGQFRFLASDSLLRGITREYMSMALVDADFRAMHTQADHEYEAIVSTALMRRYPQLSDARRGLLVQMLFVSFEGLIIALTVDSPVVSQPEAIVKGIVNAFRHEVERVGEPGRSKRAR
jgi:AcrR family transcriptional regulator